MTHSTQKIPVHLELSKEEFRYLCDCFIILSEMNKNKKEEFEKFIWGMVIKLSGIDKELRVKQV